MGPNVVAAQWSIGKEAMARRDKPRKTSLGNTLESSVGAGSSDAPESSARGRSASESSAQPQRKARLFGSVREAMEFEAAEEEAARQARRRTSRTVVSTAGPLDVRTLSTLEKTQADEAGYTVIRRRASSDPAEPAQEQPARRRASGGGRGGKPSRERRQERNRGDDNRGARGAPTSSRRDSKVASSTTTRGATNSAWPPATSASPAARSTSAHETSSDEQHWLAAASAGAVLPSCIGSAPTTVWPSSATPSAWSSPLATASVPATLKESATPVSSQPPTEAGGFAAPASEATPATALDESMLSWLESALALDATRAASSPVASSDATNSKEDA